MAKKDSSKHYDSVEQALVEELGAVLIGTYENLGTFPIEDGDDKELPEDAVSWLGSKGLMPSGASWSEAFRAVNEVTVYIYTDGGTTEYRFKVLPDGTPSPKRFHMVEVSVFVPQKCEETA